MANSIATKKFRVLIVDDYPLILAGLAQVINLEPDLECCGEAGTVARARKALEVCQPDLVTMDLRLPDGDGLEFIKELVTGRRPLPVLVISQCDESIYAERVLKAGARGYVMKERGVEDVVAAIRCILGGGLYVSPRVAALALQQMAGRKPSCPDQLEVLTNRELQVLQLLGAGLGSRAIAARLSLSVKTVETHRENIKRKLKIRDAAALVHYATQWVEGEGMATAPPMGAAGMETMGRGESLMH